MGYLQFLWKYAILNWYLTLYQVRCWFLFGLRSCCIEMGAANVSAEENLYSRRAFFELRYGAK